MLPGNTMMDENVGDGLGEIVPQGTFSGEGSGGVKSNTVTFVVKPTFTNSPLAVQRQVFHPGVPKYTNIYTPFGIPFWGDNLTSGQWKLVVRNNHGQVAKCYFTVVSP